MLWVLAVIAPTFAHEPAIEGPPPPLPPAVPLGVGLPIISLCVLALVWWVIRRWSRPGTRSWARNAAFGVAIGNALLDIESMLQPDRPRVEDIQRIEDERPSSSPGDGPGSLTRGTRSGQPWSGRGLDRASRAPLE